MPGMLVIKALGTQLIYVPFVKHKPFYRPQVIFSMYIVNYHNIVNNGAYDQFDKELFTRISVNEFEQEIEFLYNRFNLVSLEQLVHSLETGREIPNALALTFDDGYKGVYQFGLPIIESYGTTGSLFIITSYPSNNQRFCFEFDKVEIAFRISEKKETDFSDLDLNIKHVKLANIQQKAQYLRLIKKELKNNRIEVREQIYQNLLLNLDVTEDAIQDYARKHDKYAAMNWTEINDASKRGHCIGSHTVSHNSLTQITLEEAKVEIRDSFETIKNNVKTNWIPFAYPYGRKEHISQQITQLVWETGYRCGLTTLGGANYPRGNLFRLKRVEFENGRFI